MLEFRTGIITPSPTKKNQACSTLSLSVPLEGILSAASLGTALQHSGYVKAVTALGQVGAGPLQRSPTTPGLGHDLLHFTSEISTVFAEQHRRQLLLPVHFSSPGSAVLHLPESAMDPSLETLPEPRGVPNLQP